MFTVGRLRFEWDEEKAAANLYKHEVSFEEAATAFTDPLASIMEDVVHSPREALIGHSRNGKLLVASFTMRGDIVRLISPRLVTNNERKDYEEGRL